MFVGYSIAGDIIVKTTFLIGSICISLFSFTAAAVAADGWASTNGDTTGGAGGTVVTVDNVKDLEHYAEMGTTPYIVRISGTIDIGTGVVEHNWWSNNCHERLPRVRYGRVHCYNNYYDCSGNKYCIGVGVESNIRVENNYFNNVDRPWADYYKGKAYRAGVIGWNTGNVFQNTTIPSWSENNYATVFKPPYSYKMDDANNVPALVRAYAGTRNPYPPK